MIYARLVFAITDGLISEEDWRIIAGGKYGQRIEIDNVIAAVGAERFWKKIILASYEDLFDTADMTMSLKQIDYVALSRVQLLNECVETHCKANNKSKIEEIDSEYNNYNYLENGFIEDIDAEESEISDRIEEHELANESNSWLNNALVPIIEEYQKRTKLNITTKEKPRVETKRFKLDSDSKNEDKL